MGNFKSHTARAAAVKLFDRVPSAKIPQTTNLCLFQRPFFAFLCRISSLPSYLSWTFVQFYTQTDCRDLHVRSKSGNVYATEIEKLPFIRCFAAKSISNSCWQVLVGHEHLTGWIISAKKQKKRKLASEGLPYPYFGWGVPKFYNWCNTDMDKWENNMIFIAIFDGSVKNFIERRQTVHNKSINLVLYHKN